MSTPGASEWKVGWRIVAASSLANATGISLLFLTFNLFLLPMNADLGLSRSQAGVVQSLVIMAALGAPFIGWLTDRLGFHPVFLFCTLALGGIELAMAQWGSSFAEMALAIALIGFLGGGAAGVLIVRPVSAHFSASRGLALGLVGAGISISTIFAAPWLEQVIALQGWRQGFRMLGAITLILGLPLVLLLMPRSVSLRSASDVGAAPDRAFLRNSDFWKLVLANMAISLPVSGSLGHLSPMLQERGLDAATAALGLSAFATGQLVGKLGSGWLLDRFEPRHVAAALNVLPSMAFVLLLTSQGHVAGIVFAAALLGLLQGSDISLFPYLVAQRFDMRQFGTVLGTVHGLGWIATAAGLVSFGAVFDVTGSYGLVQLLAIGSLTVAGALLLALRPVRN